VPERNKLLRDILIKSLIISNMYLLTPISIIPIIFINVILNGLIYHIIFMLQRFVYFLVLLIVANSMPSYPVRCI
jgi:hypothetical protein